MSGARAHPPAFGRMILSSPVTHSDWMLRESAPAWGPVGVREILDRCAACGWKRVYWRCFDGGRSLYPSRLMEPMRGFDDDNYHADKESRWVGDVLKQFDYGAFDCFRAALDYGREIGLEIHAWLSINEDDHGWGLISRFAREHPVTCWVTRDGRRYRSQLSFAFPEVRAYKLALVEEILAYAPDGIFFDWIRTGDVRDNPQTEPDGWANHGYEEPNLRRFRELTGLDAREVPTHDERWLAMRAEPQTLFMRDAAALIRGTDPSLVVSAMVQHPWSYRGAPDDTPYAGSLPGLLADVRAWAREGLIDEAVAAGYYRPGGTPENAYRWLEEETEGCIPLWLYGWLHDEHSFRTDLALARKVGAGQLLLWESDYLVLPPDKTAVIQEMRAAALGEVPLKNGRTVRLRAACPSDAPLFLGYFAGLSAASRDYMHGWSAESACTPAHAEHLAARTATEDHCALVALDGEPGEERIVGYCWLDGLCGEERIPMLGIGIIDEFHEAGLGRALMRRMLEHAAGLGLERVRLGVWENNRRAMHVYESLGFLPDPTRPARDFDGRRECYLVAETGAVT